MANEGWYIENAILPCCPGTYIPDNPIPKPIKVLATEDEAPILDEEGNEIEIETP